MLVSESEGLEYAQRRDARRDRCAFVCTDQARGFLGFSGQLVSTCPLVAFFFKHLKISKHIQFGEPHREIGSF